MKLAEIYGDSIMKGVLYDEHTGKYRTLSCDLPARFAEKFGLTLKNRSRFGCTITKGEKMLENALLKEEERGFYLLEYGGNDCDFRWAEVAAAPASQHMPNTPPAEFEGRFRRMVDAVKHRGSTPVAMSLPPIDAEKYFSFIVKNGADGNCVRDWLGDVQMIYRYQELYSSIVTRVAYETGCVYVDARGAFLDKHNYKDLLCDDGLHPNENGHQLIYSAFSAKAAEIL